MTTVSVVECVSPVSLRTCGSSNSSILQNRKRLQTKCISPNKQSSPYRCCSHDRTKSGLESTLVSSPIPSPIPRATISLCGSRASRNTIIKSPSSTSVVFSDGEADKEVLLDPLAVTPELCIVGSKPRLHGMWEIEDSRSASPLKCPQSCTQNEEELFDQVDACDERMSSVSPDNPPPSPINFLPDGFVIGGQKLICPERVEHSLLSHNRDFNPGFVKQPQHHCVKCQGRVIEKELSQVTLHRRLSSILSRHTSKQNVYDDAMTYCKEHTALHQRRASGQSDTHGCSQLHEKLSFNEIYAEKKRLKEEKERLRREEREIRKEEKRLNELTKLKEKIQRKERRSQKTLNRNYTGRNSSVKAKTVEIFEDRQNSDHGSAGTDLSNSNSNSELHLPPINTKISPPNSAGTTKCNVPKSVQLPFAAFKTSTDSVGMTETHTDVQSSRSDTVWQIEKKVKEMSEKSVLTDTEAEKRKLFSTKRRLDLELPTPMKVSSWKRYAFETMSTGFDSSTTLTSGNVCMSVSTEENSELQKIKMITTDDSYMESDATKLDFTMTSTMIVPERDTPCSQWISFNGDNEPVLNTSPDVDEGCDTFLKRLQRTKLINQSDAGLPSGQQFCFEAMVDKRYNRWKRRRRKKQSEARRINVAQSSESSDENDGRNTVMERIIDKMYEEIHGPVPQTPNGSRDTPRSRNRRRRKETYNAPKLQEEDDDVREQASSVSLYEASSEWTSDGALPSYSSSDQARPEVETVTYEPEEEMLQPVGSEVLSDDLCSWPYLEQYKSEILKRLKSTPPDQIEDLDQNDWLPDFSTQEASTPAIDSGYQSKGHFYIGSPDTVVPEDVPGNSNQDTLETGTVDIQNESTNVQETDNIEEDHKDADNTTDEYEPYIRVDETPRQSPVQAVIEDPEYFRTNMPMKSSKNTDPTKQTYSYTKWSRSQKPAARKTFSTEQKSKPLSRSSATSSSEMGYNQRLEENTQAGDTSITSKELPEFRPIIRQENTQATKDRLAKKNQKVALNIKKHNVNLPSLTKNSRSQTLPDTGAKISREKTEKPAKVKQKTTKSYEDRPKTESPRNSTPTRTSFREGHSVPEFLFKDYLRSLYGYKTRINSHVDSSKPDKGLRKTLTVDNLELLSKRPKKKPDSSKPNELSFTRSFTFSMFDLPDMYKLYNTTLERRANGEEIETQE